MYSGLVGKVFTAGLCFITISIEVYTTFLKMLMDCAGRIDGQVSDKIVVDVVRPIHSFGIKVGQNLQALKCGVVDTQLDFQQIEMRLSQFSNSMSNDLTIQHSLIYI
ncbi:Hypothetical_protein [Hexamita inflata]|uniref:Hypothetical_protein n=1 Tax=Hexamita inflata TaxID=28002 RepID=A0ABP1GF58_9EUKA